MEKMKRFLCFFTVTGAVLFLAGCEAVFTFCPVTFLQRPASSLTAEQQLEYAQDALASGDAATMESAYAALKALLDAGSTDSSTQYTASQLAMELSGAPAALMDALTALASGSAADLDISALDTIDTTLLIEAAQYLQDAKENGADLTATDYALGGLGLLLEAADGDIDNIATLTTEEIETATDFVLQGIEDLDLAADDPLTTILEQFSDLLQYL